MFLKNTENLPYHILHFKITQRFFKEKHTELTREEKKKTVQYDALMLISILSLRRR